MKDEWHVLRCISIPFLKVAMVCNRLRAVSRTCAFALLSPKGVGCRLAPVRNAQLWLLPAHCPKTLNCVKTEPNTGSCSGLFVRDPSESHMCLTVV